MASPFCTERVRERLIFSEAAREDVVLPFNPLLYETQAHYKVSRATEFKPYLQTNYDAYHGMADLYVYFYELGLRVLRPGGLLSFIVTNK